MYLMLSKLSVIKNLLLTRSITLALVFALNIASASPAFAQTTSVQDSEPNALLEKYAALKDQLAQNQFRRPLFLESSQTADTVSSTAYAVLDSPFNTVSAAFKTPNHWCEVLILHINTKYCRANVNPSTLAVNIGKKTPQPLTEGFLLEFSYKVAASTPNYLAVQLHAAKGPMSTTAYQIEFQAVPLPEGKTFINLRYSYGYGAAGRLAMQAYLATVGRGKVGFTKITQDTMSGYIGGMRGTVERNTMRYYLAIEAYLASLKQPPAHQFDSRVENWFDATEQFPQQLHEVDRASYLAMKKKEYQRQQAVPVIAN
jgi:hypothetical protein